MAKIIKEIIIILLICLISMLIFAISLYNYIPNRKVVAEVAQYETSAEVEALLADNIDSQENEIVLTYEVTSKDLNSFEAKNEYVPGKANPFAATASKATGEGGDGNTANTGNTTENTTGNTTTKEPVDTNTSTTNSFVEDPGTK